MKSIIAVTITATLAFIYTNANALEFSPREVGPVMEATGFVSTSERGLQKVMDYCAAKYATLKSKSKKAITIWKKTNGKTITHSNRLKGLVIKDITQLYGNQKAAEFENNMQQSVESQTATIVNQIKSLPPDKREDACVSWISSIEKGQWDIKTKNPMVYKLITVTYKSK